MEEQEFYDSLFSEFGADDYRGTFTSWLVQKMGVINVYIERLRAELSQARRAQGVPHERHRALEMDNQRLRDQLNDNRRRTLTPAVGQPRPAVAPPPADPNPWTRANDWRTRDGPVDWRNNTTDALDDMRQRLARQAGTTNIDTRRGPDAVGEQERLEAIRRNIERLQADAQDRDRGES